MLLVLVLIFVFKQKTAYDVRISDWSSDVCSSDLEGDAVLEHHVGGGVLAAGGHGAHVDAVAAQRVHADAVAQQRAAGAAAGGVDRDHGDAHLREAGEEAVEQFVGDRGLAGRSEEHTSELQSLMRISYAVFCLKKKKQTNYTKITSNAIA